MYTNFESISYWQIYLDGLKLNGAGVILAQYRVLRRPHRLRAPERDLAITNLGETCFFNLVSKSAVKGRLLNNGFALTEKSVMCLETQLLD